MMRVWLILAGLMGAEAIIGGAMAAHMGLSEYQVELVEKAIQYEIYHALALIGIAILSQEKSRLLMASGIFFSAGVVLFCGTLFMLGFWEMRPFALSAPLGGSCLILGWLSLALYGVMRGRSPAQNQISR